MSIRKAKIEDIASISELFDAYRVWYRKDSDLTKAKAFLKDRIVNNESVIFVKEHEGELIGFTQLYPIFSSTRMQKMWLLNDLFVKSIHRGNGYSKQLIAAAKELCKSTNACGILLETEKSNEVGNKLYPSEGFHLEDNNFYFWTKKD